MPWHALIFLGRRSGTSHPQGRVGAHIGSLANSGQPAQVWDEMSVTDPHIKSEKRGSLGLLTLDRPQALNALTHGMINAIAAQLTAWATDSAIGCVAIQGAGGRAFCAGGDIRAVQRAVVAGAGRAR